MEEADRGLDWKCPTLADWFSDSDAIAWQEEIARSGEQSGVTYCDGIYIVSRGDGTMTSAPTLTEAIQLAALGLDQISCRDNAETEESK